jgi:hypothetical protein
VEAVIAYFKVVSQNLHGMSEENLKNQLVSIMKFGAVNSSI